MFFSTEIKHTYDSIASLSLPVIFIRSLRVDDQELHCLLDTAYSSCLEYGRKFYQAGNFFGASLVGFWGLYLA